MIVKWVTIKNGDEIMLKCPYDSIAIDTDIEIFFNTGVITIKKQKYMICEFKDNDETNTETNE